VTLIDYMRSFVRGWTVLLVGLLLGAGVGAGVAKASSPEYTATTQLFISSSGAAADVTAAAAGNTLSLARATAYVELLTSQEFAARLTKLLGLDLTPQQVAKEIAPSVVASTPIINVAVTDASPQRALRIAQGIDQQFNALVRQVEGVTSINPAPVTITVTETPTLPTRPSSPNLPLYLEVGALVGLVVAMIVAVMRDRLDKRVRNDAAAATAAGAPVLGLIPKDAEAARRPLGTVEHSRFAEAVQVVASNLRFVMVEAEPGALLVTSPNPGEGTTTTALSVARALAESGRRVLVVDANLRSPSVAPLLGLAEDRGLAQVLAGQMPVEQALQSADGRFAVLGAGTSPRNPTQLLSGPVMAKLLAELVNRYEVVVLDSPALLRVADTANLAGLAGGVLLCTRWGVTASPQITRSRELLDRAHARILGVVTTFTPPGRGPHGAGADGSAAAEPARALPAARQATGFGDRKEGGGRHSGRSTATTGNRTQSHSCH
jgi:capsular exopolysaccharide synthesis family protein